MKTLPITLAAAALALGLATTAEAGTERAPAGRALSRPESRLLRRLRGVRGSRAGSARGSPRGRRRVRRGGGGVRLSPAPRPAARTSRPPATRSPPPTAPSKSKSAEDTSKASDKATPKTLRGQEQGRSQRQGQLQAVLPLDRPGPFGALRVLPPVPPHLFPVADAHLTPWGGPC